MSFQSSVNQAIGTIGAVAGAGKMIKNQQQANELAKISATDKAIDEYLANNEEVKASVNKDKIMQGEMADIDKKQELFANAEEGEASPQAMAFESARLNLQNAINAKVYQDRALKMRMDLQDKQWKTLGVDKDQLRELNSPEDRQMVKDFKARVEGGKQ